MSLSELLQYNQFERFQPPHPDPAGGGSSEPNDPPPLDPPLASTHRCPWCPVFGLVVSTYNIPRIFDQKCKILCAMYKKLKLLGHFVAQTPYRSLAPGLHCGTSDLPAPLAALSGNESLCFSLQLCFSNDVCSAPNSWRTRTQRHGFMVG